MTRGLARRSASTVIKRSLLIAGHSTSISLEDAFWAGLKAISQSQGRSTAELVAEIDSRRETANLSSAVRVFVLDFYRSSTPSTEAGSPGLSGAQ